MIISFSVNKFEIILIFKNQNLKIFGTNYTNYYYESVKEHDIRKLCQDLNIKPEEYILKLQEMELEGKLQIDVNEDDNNLKIFLYTLLKSRSIKIKYGEYCLGKVSENSFLTDSLSLITSEIKSIATELRNKDELCKGIQIENETIMKDYKSFADEVLSRENKLISKMCFLLNEKKERIKELEAEIEKWKQNRNRHGQVETSSEEEEQFSTPVAKELTDLKNNESSKDVDLDEANDHEQELFIKNKSDSEQKTGLKRVHEDASDDDDDDDELFPESMNPKLTATPIKMREIQSVQSQQQPITIIETQSQDSVVVVKETISVESNTNTEASVIELDKIVSKETTQYSLSNDLFDNM